MQAAAVSNAHTETGKTVNAEDAEENLNPNVRK